MKDSFDLEVSGCDASAVAAIDSFAAELLAMGKGVTEVLDAADSHPDVPLLQIYATCVWLYGQTAATDREAQKYGGRFQTVCGVANERELQLLGVVTSWQRKAYAAAALALENYVDQWRTDLVAAKVLEFLYYLLGQHYSGPRFLRTFGKLYNTNAHDGYFLASYSFALELNGRYDEAVDTARRAIDHEARNPWAHHTLAHVYLKQGDLSHGTGALESYRDVWNMSGEAIHSHNSWHLALMYVEALNRPPVLELLHEVILREQPYLVIQELDAISLLWRLELAGLEVDSADWTSVADQIGGKARERHIAFNSAHYVYALVRAGREAEAIEAIREIRSKVTAVSEPEKAVWDRVGVALLDATVAHATGDHGRAAALLAAIIDDIPTVGGSDAQDDLFRQMFVLSLIGAGNKSEARTYTEEAFPTTTPLHEYWRSRV